MGAEEWGGNKCKRMCRERRAFVRLGSTRLGGCVSVCAHGGRKGGMTRAGGQGWGWRGEGREVGQCTRMQDAGVLSAMCTAGFIGSTGGAAPAQRTLLGKSGRQGPTGGQGMAGCWDVWGGASLPVGCWLLDQMAGASAQAAGAGGRIVAGYGMGGVLRCAEREGQGGGVGRTGQGSPKSRGSKLLRPNQPPAACFARLPACTDACLGAGEQRCRFRKRRQ